MHLLYETTSTSISSQNNLYRIISIILNFIWGLALLPLAAFAFVAVISTIMLTDSGQASELILYLIILDTFLFGIIPITTCVAIILSFSLRKEEKYLLAVLIQLAPIINAVLAFGVLLLVCISF